MKHRNILLFFGCLVVSFCSAQPIPNDIPGTGTRVKATPVKRTGVAVIFTSNDSCNLRINGIDYGEIAGNKSKTVMLPLGDHRFFFESLETGETIKRRSFQLTRDSVRDRMYTYPPVTFKQTN